MLSRRTKRSIEIRLLGLGLGLYHWDQFRSLFLPGSAETGLNGVSALASSFEMIHFCESLAALPIMQGGSSIGGRGGGGGGR